MLEIGETAFLRDLFFEMLHRAGDIEDLDRPAVAADEVVLMMIFAQAVVRRAAVEADPADDAALFETGDETVNSRRIARDIESRTGCDLLQRHGLIRRGEDFQTGLESCRPSQAGRRAFRKEVFDTGGRFTAHTVRPY